MRIAVYHALPAGGARRLVSEVIRRSSVRHTYDLFTLDLGYPDDDDVLAHAAAVHRIPLHMGTLQRAIAATPLRTPGAMARIQAAERRVAACIEAGGYDICWVHHTDNIQAPFLLRHLTVPTLYYVHEPRRPSFEAGANESPYVRRSALRRGLSRGFEEYLRHSDRASTAAATYLACNSRFTAEAVQRAYGREAWVCYPGVDAALFSPGKPAVPLPQHPYVLAVGALHWLKRHEMVIDAMALTADPRPVLVIVYGREVRDCRQQLMERATRAGVALQLRRGISDAELVDLYRGAITTVCASRLEPFGLTALESASTGTPVVAVAEGGFRETVLPGRNGCLVEPDPASIAAGIKEIRSGTLRNDATTIRATVVPNFTWEATVSRLHTLFDRVVGARSR